MTSDKVAPSSPLPSPAIAQPSDEPVEQLVLACIEAGFRLGFENNRLTVKAPAGATNDELIARLRQRRSELETFMAQDAERERVIALGPVRHPDNDAALSNGQERLWFLFQFEEDAANYNMFGAYRVVGEFSYQALDSALQAIMFRHQVFRSYIENYDGELVHKRAPVSRVHVPVDDLSGLDENERERAVSNWLQLEAETAFELSEYPLWRFRLVRVAEHEHILAFSVHHIICDGQSELILLDELQHWYSVFLANPDAEVPEVPIRYCDYAAWQKTYLGSYRYLEALAWWKKTLADAPPLLGVPTDRPRPLQGSTEGGWVNFKIEQSVTEKLWQIGRDNNTTTFMVGLSLYGLLLRDFSGQDDLVVGTPVSNRGHPDLEGLVGFFVNSVPLRLQFDADMRFEEVVRRVSAGALDAFDRQHVPFEHLVEALGVRREPSHNPIFQALFAMEDQSEEDDEQITDELIMKPLDVDVDSAMFDLDLLLSGHEAGYILGGFNYNADLYDHATIERMCARFEQLCRLVAENPAITLGELRDPDNVDADSVNVGVGERIDYPLDTTIDAQFARQASETPDAIAIEHNARAASYAEIDAWSQDIAAALGALGAGKGRIVAVETKRGIAFLAAILGVLRTGATYVPIDPEYPDERRQHMIEDSAATVLIREHAVEGVNAGILTIGDYELHLASLENGRPLEPLLPGNSPVAYMIYTSGSTGKPKGAMVRHDGALNHIHAEVDALGVADDFVFLQTAASSSDISVWQFFGPILYGGRCVVVDTHTLLEAPKLFSLMQRSAATVVELVPGVIQLLCEHVAALSPEARALPHLRSLLITGEAAPVPLVNQWLSLYPDVPVVNAYGPTEAADDVCQAVIDAPLAADARSVPIGRPLANLSLYVLDAALCPVPLGASGEICVAGVGVGAGYHARAEQTARAFVENPFATGEHDRHLYRTGDLGRWRRDGQLDFIGRVDTQVKVRGFRLELGEITACIVTEPRVREAATILGEGENGEPSLIGYYSCISDASLEPAELREHLKTQLPQQIVPNLLIVLEDLPHLPNGKIDVNSLPRPEVIASAELDESELSDNQVQVRRIWTELLGAAPTLEDDFFNLGGHSLLAVRMLARVKERFGKDVSIAAFFATPTLGEFCDTLEATEESSDTVSLVATGKTRYPLSPGQARLWFLHQFEDDATTYNMPGALHFRGHLDIDAFTRTLARLIERHPSMRTRFDVENGVPYQEILPPTAPHVPVIDLTALDREQAGKQVSERIEAMLATCFRLEDAPLWHFEIIRVAEDDVFVLNVAHHIVTDGLSNELLIAELVQIYAAEVAGQPLDLPPIEHNYGDYAEWQLALQATNRHRRQQLYWERKLAGAPALLDLPTDRPRPATQTYNGDDYTFALNSTTVPALRALAQTHSATMFMLFQAAMAALLQRYSGQDDIVVGTPIGGRQLAELEPIVGFFVNTVVLRSVIDTDSGFDVLLDQVRQSAIEAFEHRDVPFERMVERVVEERNPAFSPIFQVMVAYEEDTDEGDGLTGLDVDVVELREKTAMFDLDVLFDDEGGDEIDCTIVYNTDLFDRSTIVQMARHLDTLLAAIVAHPDRALSEIALLDDSDHAELAALETGPTPAWTHDRTLVDLFLEHKDNRANAIAATDGSRSIDYAELDRQSAWLAAELVGHGIGPGSFVAIVQARSIDFLTSILAVLRASAAYVPIDPSYPAPRIAHMLRDSAAEVVLASRTSLATVIEGIGEGTDRTVLVLPDDGSVVTDTVSHDTGNATIEFLESPTEPVNAPALNIHPESPAYMIYTSGSTGKPKGAINTHRGQANHILAEADLLDLDRKTVFAQTAPSSSDISVWQFLAGPLLGGSTAIIAADDLLMPEQLLARFEQDGVTLVELVPALFEHLLDHLDELEGEDRERASAILTRLDAAMITGEAAPVALVRRWLDTVPGVPLINAYGPTEAADDVCQQRIESAPAEHVRNVPIGVPLPGVTVSILDSQSRRVPRGTRGEICVSGPGVGAGYWRRPELTESVFVANPLATGDDDRILYRTGDIGRWNRDGVLEYLGRADGQVQMLGMRIELGEIENALSSLAEIREAAVIVTDETPPRLVAFWVADLSDVTEAALEDRLRQVLPNHMVPRSWIRLESLPRNPIGKVDRARLPLDAAAAAFAAREYVAPESDEELTMSKIWSEVLQTERISVNADFFELGGNSLLAVQAVRRIAQQFDVEVPLVEFFRASTITELLATIARLREQAVRDEAELDEIQL